jgi:DNA-binding NarL/FixJ family response regulator
MKKTRLIIASSIALHREGMKTLVHRIKGMDVVGEAIDGHEAVSLAVRLRPEVAILDDFLPRLNGVDAVARMVERVPDIRILLLSEDGDAVAISKALRAGARGCLLRSATLEDLRKAIQRVLKGDLYLSAGLSRQLLAPTRRARDPLTPRQREVLQMIAEGWTTKQIGQILRISVKTVETHRSQVMERLSIFDVPGLVRYALKNHITRL